MLFINELVEWQKKIFEHGPTWSLTIGSLFLIIGLLPSIIDAGKHKKTFSTSQSFFLLWGMGCLCIAGNAAMYFVKDIVNGTNKWSDWMGITKYCSFGVSNIIAATASFYGFLVKRKNLIESSRLDMSEEQYWETVINGNSEEEA